MVDKDKIIKEVIGEDFETIRYHDDCYITVRECKKIMDVLESELKKLRVTDVSGSDGCLSCENNLPEKGYWCATNCIKGSMFKPSVH